MNDYAKIGLMIVISVVLLAFAYLVWFDSASERAMPGLIADFAKDELLEIYKYEKQYAAAVKSDKNNNKVGEFGDFEEMLAGEVMPARYRNFLVDRKSYKMNRCMFVLEIPVSVSDRELHFKCTVESRFRDGSGLKYSITESGMIDELESVKK